MLRAEQPGSHAGVEGADRFAALKRLLVGVDDSDASGAATAFALRLAGAAGADVTLLHALSDLSFAAHAGHTAHPELLSAAAELRLAATGEWQRRLQNLADYAPEGVSVEWRVVRAPAAAALLSAAREFDSDLILVGSRGVSALRERFLGSVSSQVVDHAPCSVMVFPEEQISSPAHVRSVVVGIDGSPGGDAALTMAAPFAAALEATLVLVSAYDGVTALAPPSSDVRAQLQRSSAAVVTEARAGLGSGVAVAEELYAGNPRRGLVDVCERYGPSVLVVGTRGLGGFQGLLLGSTSRWLLNHAPCPVLVARSRPDDRKATPRECVSVIGG